MPVPVADSLRPTTANTPLDARCVVATLAEIPYVTLPYLGMRIYCLATGLEYRVTALASKQIGALSVPDAAVGEFEPVLEDAGAIEAALDAILGGSALPVVTGGGAQVASIAAGNNVVLSNVNGVLTISATGGGGGSGSVVSASAIVCLCTHAPQSLVDGLIWVYGGTSTPVYYAAIGGVAVLTSEPASVAGTPDGTIIIAAEEEEEEEEEE